MAKGKAAPPQAPRQALLFAKDAEYSTEYLNWPQDGIFVRKSDMVFGFRSTGGDSCDVQLKPLYPLLVDDVALAGVREQYDRARRVFLWKCGVAQRAPIKEGEAATPKRMAAARGNVSARTGYPEGTDGHKLGGLALENMKAGRAAVVAAMQGVLVARFDTRKARALAQSWVSTLIRKRPDIYAGLKGGR